MNPIEVIEAMLAENEHRAALLASGQIRAIERMISLDTGLTATGAVCAPGGSRIGEAVAPSSTSVWGGGPLRF
jgi:hypothetical protein